jgi:Spx/MgsR family transcriptional regulator
MFDTRNMTTLYGIPNCDTVKKARVWLTDRTVDYAFHDFKKQGVSIEQLNAWAAAVGIDKLLNRQGTTWRALSDADKARADSLEGAIALLQEKPSMIKRPVLEHGGKVTVGFNAATYEEAFPQ